MQQKMDSVSKKLHKVTAHTIWHIQSSSRGQNEKWDASKQKKIIQVSTHPSEDIS